ncbi:Methyltransferase protein [Salix suchowensis]|nr:Methyltransferase protein [Salix suchowensis]
MANLTPEALRSAAKQSERCHIVPLPSKSTSEVRGRLPGFSPTKVLDFGAGTGSAFWFDVPIMQKPALKLRFIQAKLKFKQQKPGLGLLA